MCLLLKAGRSSRNCYSRLQMKSGSKREAPQCQASVIDVQRRGEGGVLPASDQPAQSAADALVHMESAYRRVISAQSRGEVRGMGSGAEGVISASLQLCHSRGRQTEKSILPLRTVHYKGLPRRRYLSESLPQAGWHGIGVRAH